MDLRLYYQKIRQTESGIAFEFPIVISKETADGGKPGVLSEVPRAIAAKMVVDGSAEVAHGAQATAFRKAQAEAKKRADDLAEAAKVQIAVIPVPKTPATPSKGA